jgi:aspartate carbamoyltransferase regulatory subunit
MMQKERGSKEIIYPNYHVPPEYRSILVQPLDSILANQGNSHLKRIAFMYFSQLFENTPTAFKDEGILIDENKLIISPLKLSQRTNDHSKSRYVPMIENLENVIRQSRVNQTGHVPGDGEVSVLSEKDVSNSLYKHINDNYFNLIELNPTLYRKLTGKVDDNFKKQTVMMIESVKLNNDFTIEIHLSNFMKAVRDHVKKQILNNKSIGFSDPNFFPVNYNELSHFKSPYAIQLYLRISKEQFYSNKLIINVEELAGYLGYTENALEYSTKAFLKKLKSIVQDPGLTKSTCALLPIKVKSGNDKTQFWIPAKKDKKKLTHIELRFKNNDELQQMLLSQPYGFIKHIKDGALNKAIQIQIIKRVYDEIIEEKYVNYCVNKAYQYIEKDTKRAKEHESKGIGPLAWDYIKDGQYREEYLNKEDMWDVSQPVGLSITKYQKEHQPELDLKVSQKKKAVTSDEVSFWSYLESLFSPALLPFYDYAKKNLPFEQLHKRLDIEKDTVNSVKVLALSDFRTINREKLIDFISDLGFEKKKAVILFNLMSEQTSIMFFEFLVDGRLEIPSDQKWRKALTDEFKDQLTQIF